jgi:E3 ubiquitin-protein ligase HUWE1
MVMFLTAMAPIVWRDPAIFMQAAAMVCQIETIGGHPTMIFAKGKERSGQEQGQGQRRGKRR